MSTQTYYTLLTAVGAAALTNALAAGTTVALTHLALGDGAGDPVTPTEAATALVHEVHRVPITSVTADPENPSWLVIEAVVPSTVGGWTVRELGLIAAAGTLIAIGNFPPTYKPVLVEGAGRDLLIRMIVETTNASQVTLTIDPAVVLATNQAIVNAVAAHEAKADPHPQYVLAAGDTMTGPLTLSGPPTAAMHAASRSYVDALAAQRARRFFHAGF
ncbi:MAG TPA: phage tail protein [Rhodocyclaceae bacterium]|uniref:phage tail protein n=1 Tax=Plasticicumulans sp. TaxID=2307179 RepID=UPI002B5607E3|nr:phage tail protein [Rhodocyclaceae bacterium]